MDIELVLLHILFGIFAPKFFYEFDSTPFTVVGNP